MKRNKGSQSLERRLPRQSPSLRHSSRLKQHHRLATFVSHIVRTRIGPLLSSVPIRVVAFIVICGLSINWANRAIQQHVETLVPTHVTLLIPGNSALEASLGKKLQDEANLASAKKHSKKRFLNAVTQTLSRYPAIESAVLQSRLDRTMRISIYLHRPELEVKDRSGKRFIFGSQLKPVHSPGNREPIEGLGAAPLVLVMEDADLRWDKLGRGLLRIPQQGSTPSSPVNIAWLHQKSLGLMTILSQLNTGKGAGQQLQLYPPATFFFRAEEGLSFCLAGRVQAALEPEAKGSSQQKCTKVVLGQQISLSELGVALSKLRDTVTGASAAATLVDLRIPGRAIIRSDTLAEIPKP